MNNENINKSDIVMIVRLELYVLCKFRKTGGHISKLVNSY